MKLDEDAAQHLVRLAGGDARRSLTYLEASAGAAQAKGATVIDLATAETAVDQAAVRYDREGDQHYDVISAFIKSLRGSDADAALHYLARMLEAGEDPRFIARRLVILASEDIGLADPSALTTAVAAAQAVQLIGMPEAQLNLAQATIALAVAPKSNAVVKAIGAARADVQAGKIGSVPAAPAGRPLPWREEHRARVVVHLQPRRALRDRRTAVRARRGPRRRVLPADEPGRRGRGQGALGADQAADPRLRRPAIGSGTVNQPLVVAGTWIGAAALLVLVLIGYLVTVRRARRELAETRREAAELRSRIDGLTERMAEQLADPSQVAPDPTEYVITAIGSEPDPELVPERIDGRLFADIVLREAVVRAAALAHGVRRALAPETRNRIRFEMRREVKRSRRQRRADLKTARRDWEARQRAGLEQDENAA